MKPLILITNDDGITAKGIATLVEAMRTIGNVLVVAPDSPNSGMGHAITMDTTIQIKKSSIFEGIESYECSGTPADCVKLAKHELFADRKIDLVVSGINHGSNSSLSVIYSGTMSAAIEAAIEGIPAIGFSLDNGHYDADFSHTIPYIHEIVQKVLSEGITPHTALNVNFPKKKEGEEIKGIKVCRQANGYWKESFDARQDPYGRPYFWMGGNFVNRESVDATDHDVWALENGYVSVVPCQYDLTHYSALEKMKDWKFD